MKRFREEMEQLLKDRIPADRLEYLPAGFQRIGPIMLLKIKQELSPYEKDIGEAALRLIPSIRTVCSRGYVYGASRKPITRKIAGNGTVATHSENGCKYRLDVTRVMFSKGNTSERGRLPSLIRKGETIIDMFAGIGYFSIPIAKAGKHARIYAIEKNPHSVRFLKENITLNEVSRVAVIEGDNRTADVPEKGDRILMGYLPGTEAYLGRAFELMKDKAAMHFHNTYLHKELWKKPESELEEAAMKAGYKMAGITHRKVVKHFSPGVEHVVIDAHFRKARK